MADNQALYGFRWQKQLGLGSTPQPFRAFVATGYQATSNAINVDLRPGDPVKRVSDGSVALLAAGTEVPYGIILAIAPFYDSVLGAMKFGNSLPGGTAWGTITDRQSVVSVVPVANQVFEIDADDNTTFTTLAGYQAAFGENADLTMNGVSGDTHAYPKLDISTHATTNTLNWRILETATRVNQDYSGANVKLLVTANIAQQAPYTILGV